MAMPRQDTPHPGAGRVNQKLRTRGAIVAGAQRLLDQGDTPTVAAAAEEAMVSRTTAYRYFPTQESLLLELSLTSGLPDIEELAAQPVDADGVEPRLLEVFERLNRQMLGDEELYRRALRTYLDMWLAAHEAGDAETPTVREGRRTRWIAESVEPLRGRMPDDDLRRLEAALCLVVGVEAMLVMRDICRLEPDEAIAVSRWAAEALLHAGLPDS
jgi:AcrR family transcriptional regulator